MTDNQKYLCIAGGLLGIGLLRTGVYFYEKRREEKEIELQKKAVAELDRMMTSVREEMRQSIAEKLGTLPKEPIT